MEYLTTLYRDTSTCGISQASSDSPGKSGWALNTAWFLQHLNAKIIIIPMQWDTTILIWKVPVRITTSLSQGVFTYQLHTSTVCTDPTCIITEALFPAHPLLFVLYCSLQLKSGLDDFKSSSFFYAFKTLMLYSIRSVVDFFPDSQQCCLSGCRRGFDFPLFVIPASTSFSVFNFLGASLGHAAGFIN